MDELQSCQKTILLVDDEEAVLETEQKMLEKLGYRVLTARSGEQAIKIYRKCEETIHLVILDVVMPEMGGAEVFALLKQINPSVKVLISSGYSVDDQVAELLKQGCAGFIQKPFGIEQLSQRLREIFGKDEC